MRSKITNGKRLHQKGTADGRSAEARRFRDLVASFAASLGGEAALSEADRALIRNAAALTLQCERMQAAAVDGREVDLEAMTRLANSTARIMAALKLKRPRRDQAPSIAEIVARHAKPDTASA